MVTTAIFQTTVCNCKTVSYIATRHTSYLIGLLIFHMVVHCDVWWAHFVADLPLHVPVTGFRKKTELCEVMTKIW